MEDIFDLSKVNTELLRKLGIKSAKGRVRLTVHDKRLIELFKSAKKSLSMPELVVGYYNKYTEPLNEPIRNRNYMGVMVHRLTTKGILKRVGTGRYCLKNQDQ